MVIINMTYAMKSAAEEFCKCWPYFSKEEYNILLFFQADRSWLL